MDGIIEEEITIKLRININPDILTPQKISNQIFYYPDNVRKSNNQIQEKTSIRSPRRSLRFFHDKFFPCVHTISREKILSCLPSKGQQKHTAHVVRYVQYHNILDNIRISIDYESLTACYYLKGEVENIHNFGIY